MRAMRSTTLGFGMVVIPVKLYKITEERAVEKDIHQVHDECGTRIQMPKSCPKCNKIVPTDQLSKAYFYTKESFVKLTDADYDCLPLSSLKSVVIDGFMKPIEDRRWFNGGIYAVAPEEVGAKAFVLFTKCMQELGVWGIARMATREKEQLVAIMPSGDGVLFLQTLHWGSEVREYGEIIPFADVSPQEMDMGKKLIGAMTKPLDLKTYKDNYSLALKDLISAKLEGKEITPPPEAAKPAGGDLVEQLMASLKAMTPEPAV